MSGPAAVDRVEEAQERDTGPSERDDLSGWTRGVHAALGGLLVVSGLRRRSIAGGARVLAGGWLLARGLSGRRRPLRTLWPDTRGRSGPRGGERPVSATRTVTVRRPEAELAEIWRDPEQVDEVLGDGVEVTQVDDDRWRWTVRGPVGASLSWESRIVEERAGEVIRWASLDGAPVPNTGSVRFRPAPTDQGTEVTLTIQFDPPGGSLGAAALSRLDVVPRTLVSGALGRFKSLAETGEIPTLERNPSGRGSGDIV